MTLYGTDNVMFKWQNKKSEISNFVIYFFGCWMVLTLPRFLATEYIEMSRDIGYMLLFSLLLTLGAVLWHYARRYTLTALVFIGLYVVATYVKRFFGMMVGEREITHTLGLATILFVFATTFLYVARNFKFRIGACLLKGIGYFLYGMFVLLPLLFIGYAMANKGVFSTDIMLTLFQTNISEIWAYLQEQNAVAWIGISLLNCLLVGGFVFAVSRWKKPTFNWMAFLLTCLVLFYAITWKLVKLNLCFAVNIAQTTNAILQSFEDFSEARKKRADNLEKLRQVGLVAPDKGVYVLIIGESETRDHMQVYGYLRPTTPWLADFVKQPNTFLFENAYSNHTHTVPALTYALSAQNQYNQVDLAKAYSIVEVAKAAGYKVYWLSNQIKFSVSDTPITIMASMADVEKWINNNTGDKIATAYYDNKLVEELPDMKHTDKALIIVHLMGNHSSYRDRYPYRYDKFHGEGRRVDTYDNSILYNDEVLRLIYEKVKLNPNFMAWVYFSDHGDDPDNGLGHECTRFSYRMARVPFIVNVSDAFKQKYADDFELLQKQEKQYWTNDLIYEFMLDLMGIEGVSGIDDKYNILSPQYVLSKEKVLLLHGQKKLD